MQPAAVAPPPHAPAKRGFKYRVVYGRVGGFTVVGFLFLLFAGLIIGLAPSPPTADGEPQTMGLLPALGFVACFVIAAVFFACAGCTQGCAGNATTVSYHGYAPGDEKQMAMLGPVATPNAVVWPGVIPGGALAFPRLCPCLACCCMPPQVNTVYHAR